MIWCAGGTNERRHLSHRCGVKAGTVSRFRGCLERVAVHGIGPEFGPRAVSPPLAAWPLGYLWTQHE